MRALFALLLTLILFLMAQGTGNPFLFQAFYISAGILVISYIWSRLNLRGLNAWREVQTTRGQVGKSVEERLFVVNESIWPKLWVEIHDRSDLPGHHVRFVSSINPRERRRLGVRTESELRGRYAFEDIMIRTGDPLGLFHFQRWFPMRTEILIYPATEEIHGFYLPPAELPGGTATQQRTHYVTPNVSSIRDYVPGDSLNRIHWTSTARHRRLIVKEFELDPTADVWIIPDMERKAQRGQTWDGPPSSIPEREERTPESTEEYIVTAAASLAQHFILNQRRNTGLIGWGQRHEVIPPEREPRQFYRILESLAILRAHGDAPLVEVLAAEASRFGRRSSLVVITCSSDPQWVEEGLRPLLYRGTFATAIVVDAGSFKGWRDYSRVEAELIAHSIPFYRLEQGQPIGESLSGTTGMVEWQRGARFVTERFPV